MPASNKRKDELKIENVSDSIVTTTVNHKTTGLIKEPYLKKLILGVLLIVSESSLYFLLIFITIFVSRFFHDLISETTGYYSTFLSILASTFGYLGQFFAFLFVLMVGLNFSQPFFTKLNSIWTKPQKSSSLEEFDGFVTDNNEFFVEITKLNKKMEKEQKEIHKIKAETYQIAFETQEILSNLRSKVGII